MGRDILLGKSMPGLAPPAHAATVETPAPTATPDPGTRAFATADGVVLHVPSRNVVAIAYHEAFYRSPLPLAPLGRCVHDYNRTKFKRPRPSPGPRYIVMSSRGRGTRATSAVDVALHTGAVVLSPVTGFVSKVRHYRLYGTYPDVELTLVETGQPHFVVLMIHVTKVRVRAGDALVAGRTPVGVVRDLPFESQVNDYVGARIQHVHIEVKRVGS